MISATGTVRAGAEEDAAERASLYAVLTNLVACVTVYSLLEMHLLYNTVMQLVYRRTKAWQGCGD